MILPLDLLAPSTPSAAPPRPTRNPTRNPTPAPTHCEQDRKWWFNGQKCTNYIGEDGEDVGEFPALQRCCENFFPNQNCQCEDICNSNALTPRPTPLPTRYPTRVPTQSPTRKVREAGPGFPDNYLAVHPSSTHVPDAALRDSFEHSRPETPPASQQGTPRRPRPAASRIASGPSTARSAPTTTKARASSTPGCSAAQRCSAIEGTARLRTFATPMP